MNIFKPVALVTTLAFSSLVSAEWSATIEDDIFTGKKKASLIGRISLNQMLVFDCDSQDLTFSFLERSRRVESEDFSRPIVRLIAKVDHGKIHEFDASAGRRNENYVAMTVVDRGGILDLLKEIRNAQSKIQLGLHERLTDSRWSGTASVRGSTRETTRFLKACELE